MAKQKNTYRRRTTQVDEEIILESEQVEGFIDIKLPKKSQFNNGPFLTVFQTALYNIATKAELSKGEMKMLLFFLATAKVDNSVTVDYSILCEALGERKQNIYKHLKGLTDRNIVMREDGTRGMFRNAKPMNITVNYAQLNYDLAYNGKTNNYKHKQFTHPELLPVPLKSIEESKQISLLDSIQEIKAEQSKNK